MDNSGIQHLDLDCVHAKIRALGDMDPRQRDPGVVPRINYWRHMTSVRSGADIYHLCECSTKGEWIPEDWVVRRHAVVVQLNYPTFVSTIIWCSRSNRVHFLVLGFNYSPARIPDPVNRK